MGVQERRARQRQELRQEILEAARDLFVREGFENVSMRKVADRIEYSPTTIYLYFQDKADLLDSVCVETLAKLDARLQALRDATSDPLERLKRGFRAYVEFGLEYPNDYRVAFLTEFKASAEPPRELRCRAMGQKTFDHLRTGVAECIRQGIFAPRDVEAVSQSLWAAMHGITSLFILHPRFPWIDRDTLITAMIDIVFQGLRPA
ncbi:MAG TPA: TetR/AcrR family transcriptional regulator [Bryobacteraceae bacterium]|jgi:AcrR family transcriptional regulator|nr:TetR/AcrR family transcriptional regulator [Bryobacteraceae bacterium]